MDDSQSSDFLSESTDIFCNSPADPEMDTETYTSLVFNTKRALSTICKNTKKATFSVQFSSLLEDCASCISQSLELISDILSESKLDKSKLVEYLSDAVCLLQLLSDLIKNVIESISLECCSIKMFPTTTGNIIKLVFIHCKDSESLYGSQLNYVEKQLKDLFRTCHELQLTYLMVLEKHFIFDLTEREELDILIEALDINLKIGEIVQSLDVKTMAEQWKAYTVICEKYSSYLMDKRIFNDCTRILCSMTERNFKTALEENQEDKIVLRSLKVSSFTLKILLRVCNTFRHAVVRDYEAVMDLLLCVYLNNEAYLQTMCGKSPQFVALVNNNVTNPVHLLLTELLSDEKFVNFISNYNISAINKDDKLLGFIILLVSVVRIIVQKGKDQSLKVDMGVLINIICNVLPHCHTWFNIGLKFDYESSRQFQSYGLYEHLLLHTFVLATMMNAEEKTVLERRMIEALLSIDCSNAMFLSNLWVLIARISSRLYLFTQVTSLCKIYQKLVNHHLFETSPQKVHLTHTISRLFQVMNNEDKTKIYNMFPIHEEKNIPLWSCMKLRNLHNETQIGAEELALDNFRMQMNMVRNESVDIVGLINSMTLASTCTIINREDEMESMLLTAWSKACAQNISEVTKALDKGSTWFYKYIEALTCLTNSMEHVFHGNTCNLAKVLHTISSIVHSGCKELKLPLINILCKLADFEPQDVNKEFVNSTLKQTFHELFQDTDMTVKNKLFNTLRKHRTNTLDRIIAKFVCEDNKMQETWNNFLRYGRLKKSDIELKEQLLFTTDLKFSHKCLEEVVEIRDSGSVVMQKSLSNNFDFVDIDSLFDTEDAEPASKKAKLNSTEVEQILKRLESDASLLCKIKENVFNTEYKNRVKNICHKLNSVLE